MLPERLKLRKIPKTNIKTILRNKKTQIKYYQKSNMFTYTIQNHGFVLIL
jgi:hypothetical protein